MTHSWWWLAVDGLAVYRLTILLTRDLITGRMRHWVYERRYVRGPQGGHPIGERRWARFATNVLQCAWCTSVWAATAVTVLTVEAPHVWQFPAFALALSAAAGFLSERT